MVSIGVTGHRILAEKDKIILGIAEALEFIKQKYPGEQVSVISSIAEGADRLAAQVMLSHGATLIAPLPLEPDDYITDFETVASKEEFNRLLNTADQVIIIPEQKTRNEAYEAAGAYVLEHADILLTIWDGQGAQGQGGTGEIVALARERKMPIAWVHAGNRIPGTQEPTTLGLMQGVVTFENY